MNTEPSLSDPLQSNAVSVYQDGAMDDFPILKAFQQYIDAEQEKARKRMVTLCICFAVLTGIVITVFMALLYAMNERNQSLNDRLVEYAIKDRERDRQNAAAFQQPREEQSAAALKAMTEALAAIQKRLADDPHVTPAPARGPTAEQRAQEARQRAEAERLLREKIQIETERKLLAEEKERLRKEEVERQRRRLYPDYYAKKEADAAGKAAPAAPAPRKKSVQLSDADIQDILREADGAAEAPAVKKTPATAPVTRAKNGGLDDDSAIEYFKDDDEYQIPVDIKGRKSSWRVPLD
jgi:hypothetical protein